MIQAPAIIQRSGYRRGDIRPNGVRCMTCGTDVFASGDCRKRTCRCGRVQIEGSNALGEKIVKVAPGADFVPIAMICDGQYEYRQGPEHLRAYGRKPYSIGGVSPGRTAPSAPGPKIIVPRGLWGRRV